MTTIIVTDANKIYAETVMLKIPLFVNSVLRVLSWLMVNALNAPRIVISVQTLNALNAVKAIQRMKQVDNANPVVLDVLIVLENNAVSASLDFIQINKEYVKNAKVIA